MIRLVFLLFYCSVFGEADTWIKEFVGFQSEVENIFTTIQKEINEHNQFQSKNTHLHYTPYSVERGQWHRRVSDSLNAQKARFQAALAEIRKLLLVTYPQYFTIYQKIDAWLAELYKTATELCPKEIQSIGWSWSNLGCTCKDCVVKTMVATKGIEKISQLYKERHANKLHNLYTLCKDTPESFDFTNPEYSGQFFIDITIEQFKFAHNIRSGPSQTLSIVGGCSVRNVEIQVAQITLQQPLLDISDKENTPFIAYDGSQYAVARVKLKPLVTGADVMPALPSTDSLSDAIPSLCQAIMSNDSAAITALSSKVDKGWQSAKKVSFMHLAVRYLNEENFAKFLTLGFPNYLKDQSGYLPLHLAAFLGYLPRVKSLTPGHSVPPLTTSNCTPLFLAASQGHLENVNFLLSSYMYARANAVDTPRTDNMTPLLIAIFNGHEEVACAIIAHQYGDVNIALSDGTTALILASEMGQSSVVTALIIKKASLEASRKNGQTALLVSIEKGHTKISQALMMANANINASLLNGMTALHLCAQYHRIELVDALLAKGAKQTKDAINQDTPLMTAILYGNEDIASKLMSSETVVEPNASGEYPVMRAAKLGLLILVEEMASLITDKSKSTGSDEMDAFLAVYNEVMSKPVGKSVLLEPDALGNRFYHYIISNGHYEALEYWMKDATVGPAILTDPMVPLCALKSGKSGIVAFLHLQGFKFNVLENGWTAVHFAARHGYIEIIKRFIASGGSVDHKIAIGPDAGKSLTYLAAEGGSQITLRYLLSLNPVLESTYQHRHVLYAAIQNGNQQCLELLFQHGVDADTCLDDHGIRASHLAAKVNDTDSLDLLRRRGANLHQLDDQELSAFHYAYIYKATQTIEYLKKPRLNLVSPDNLRKKVADYQKLLLGQPNEENPNSHSVIRLRQLILDEDISGLNEFFNRFSDQEIPQFADEIAKALAQKKSKSLSFILKKVHPDLTQVDSAGFSLIEGFVLHSIEELVFGSGYKVQEFNRPLGILRQSLLIHAVAENRMAFVEDLLKKGFDVNFTGPSGVTPLHAAVQTQNAKIAKLLIKYGANHNALDHQLKTPLAIAIELGDQVLVELLCATGSNLTQRIGVDRFSYLVLALHVNNVVAAQLFFNYGIDLAIASQTGYQAIHAAAKLGLTYIVRIANEQGISLNTADFNGMTPLHYAAKHSQKEIIRLLCELGVDINTQAIPNHFYGARADSFEDHATPFLIALTYADLETVKLVVELGARTECKTKHDLGALGFACNSSNLDILDWVIPQEIPINMVTIDFAIRSIIERDNVEFLKRLLQKGGISVKKVVNESGDTMLNFASKCKSRRCYQFLIAHPDIQIKANFAKQYPIHFAVQNNDLHEIEKLARFGHFDDLDHLDRTVWHIASEQSSLSTALCLAQYPTARKSLEIANKEGVTALQIALRKKSAKLIELLLLAGADPRVIPQDVLSQALKDLPPDTAEILSKYHQCWSIGELVSEPCLFRAIRMRHPKGVEWFGRSRYLNMRSPSGETPLHYAVRFHIAFLPELLKKGAVSGFANRSGESAAYLALKMGHKSEFLQLFQADHSVVSVITKSNDSILRCACELRDPEVTTQVMKALNDSPPKTVPAPELDWNNREALIQFITEFGANTLIVEHEKTYTYLTYMTLHGHLKAIQVMVEEFGFDINQEDTQKMTPLMVAANGGYPEIVTYLLDHGCTTSSKTHQGWTAFTFALSAGHTQVQDILSIREPSFRETDHLMLMIDHGNLSACERYDQYDTRITDAHFMCALQKENWEISNYLYGKNPLFASSIATSGITLAYLAYKNHKIWDMGVILSTATMHSYDQPKAVHTDTMVKDIQEANIEKILKVMVQNGIDYRIPYFHPKFPRIKSYSYLGLAAVLGANKTIDFLLQDLKVDIDSDEEGFTPLLLASGVGWYSTVKLFMTYKANLEAVCPDGLSALHYSVQEASQNIAQAQECIRILIDSGVSIIAPTRNGWIPLTYAFLIDLEAHSIFIQDMLIKDGGNQAKVDHLKLLLDAKKYMVCRRVLRHQPSIKSHHVSTTLAAGELKLCLDYLPRIEAVRLSEICEQTLEYAVKAYNFQFIIDLVNYFSSKSILEVTASDQFCSQFNMTNHSYRLIDVLLHASIARDIQGMVVKVIAEAGADLNKMVDGETSLTRACIRNNDYIISILVELGANPFAVNAQSILRITTTTQYFEFALSVQKLITKVFNENEKGFFKRELRYNPTPFGSGYYDHSSNWEEEIRRLFIDTSDHLIQLISWLNLNEPSHFSAATFMMNEYYIFKAQDSPHTASEKYQKLILKASRNRKIMSTQFEEALSQSKFGIETDA